MLSGSKVFMLMFAILFTGLFAQNNYIMVLDKPIDLESNSSEKGVYNLRNVGNSKKYLQFFSKLQKHSGTNKIRKILRNLPNNITHLNLPDNKKFDVTFLQRCYVLESSDQLTKGKINQMLKEIPDIKSIEEDKSIKITSSPNDEYYNDQIQLHSTVYNINLPKAWNYTKGNSGIKVGIFDDGIDYNHPDLGGGFGAGYRVRAGYNFIANKSDPRATRSEEYHGTKVAGIIGALNNNNGIGVSGIAGGWQTINSGCQLFAFKVFEYAGGGIQGSLSALTEAVIEAAADPTINDGFGYGVDVMNFSNGSYNTGGTGASLIHAFAFAYRANVAMAAAKGNDATTSPFFPATFSNGNMLLSVSGVSDEGNLYPNSNYGDGVSIAAPYFSKKTTNYGNSYDDFDGTSNATPYVTGTMALIRSRFLERGIHILNDDIYNIIKISAKPKSDQNKYGAGLLDAGKALEYSSDPYTVLHTTATINRSELTVFNPPGGKLALFYPYGIYPVIETKKITATVEIPASFDINNVWVWGNHYSKGLDRTNPNWGLPSANFVSKSGRFYTFETYVYKMTNLAGNPIFWHPCTASEAVIKVSIYGKKFPLSVSISGPGVAQCQTTTWNSNITGGTPPYTYKWYHKWVSGGVEPMVRVPSDTWIYMGDSQNLSMYLCGGNSKLKVEVTDKTGKTVIGEKYVSGASRSMGKELSVKENNTMKLNTLPENYSIGNYPNPFNPTTTITYALPESGHVKLVVFNSLGQEVKILVNENKPAGKYTVSFDASNLPSGIYYYNLKTSSYSESKRMLLLK